MFTIAEQRSDAAQQCNELESVMGTVECIATEG